MREIWKKTKTDKDVGTGAETESEAYHHNIAFVVVLVHIEAIISIITPINKPNSGAVLIHVQGRNYVLNKGLDFREPLPADGPRRIQNKHQVCPTITVCKQPETNISSVGKIHPYPNTHTMFMAMSHALIK